MVYKGLHGRSSLKKGISGLAAVPLYMTLAVGETVKPKSTNQQKFHSAMFEAFNHFFYFGFTGWFVSSLNKYFFFANIQMKRDKYWFSFSFSEALCVLMDQREIKPVICPCGHTWTYL